jgi:hypothetical protein
MANAIANSFKGMLLKGQITGLTDTFKIILMKTGFVFDVDAHHAYADVSASQLANGLGYTTGGITLTGVAITVADAGDSATIAWNEAKWTATGGSLVAVGAIIYDDSTATAGDDYTDAVVAFIDAGETLTAVDGTLLRIQNISAVIS